MFRLSIRSKDKLVGTKLPLIKVVNRAIDITEVDFGVLEGFRFPKRQKELFDSGKTQTMNSKHLTGSAVDLVAYIGSEVSWEIEHYDKIARAVQIVAKSRDVSIRWGGAWHIDNIADNIMHPAEMRKAYIQLRKSQGRKPFVDGVHFELS